MANFVKSINAKIREKIEKKNEIVASKKNKGCKKVTFEPED